MNLTPKMKDAMTPIEPGEVNLDGAYIANPNDLVEDTVFSMAQNQFPFAIITNKNNQAIGIFTVTDACRFLGEVLKGHREGVGLL